MAIVASVAEPAVPSVPTDDQLVAMWLHGRTAHTVRAYAGDVARFRAFVGKALARVTLPDLQAFADALSPLAASSQGRTLAAIKSLLRYAHGLGYLPFDVGKPLRLPPHRETLADHILDEPDVQRMLALATDPRDRAILYCLYGAGVRVSELCALTWSDVQPRGESAQLNIYGKGAKTRHILLPARAWRELRGLGARAGGEPVFVSRLGGRLSESQVRRIVRHAAVHAGIDLAVTPHWLRHSHASHALDHQAPVHLVKETLGHSNLATTGKYLHARPGESSGRYLPL
jgi:integrase/recombinase XerD